jgi:hypothetical protein
MLSLLPLTNSGSAPGNKRSGAKNPEATQFLEAAIQSACESNFIRMQPFQMSEPRSLTLENGHDADNLGYRRREGASEWT